MLRSLKSHDIRSGLKIAGLAIALLSVATTCTNSPLVPARSGDSSPVDAGEGAPTADWPMWRYDANRGAASPVPLSADLHLRWTRQLPKPKPAWREEQYKLQFDRSYEPVVMGQQIFVPSMVSDSLTAYDTDTGRRNWQFFCDGPVRFAPIAWQGRVYFASDDGHLYCLNAGDGTLAWKVCLAPSGRKVLGNGRLISAWPARGGPVLSDGKLYCTAGIWPFMGVFIYALDAMTGQVIWENSGTGAIYIKQQHGSPAFAGVAPQGYLATNGNKLLLTSRTTPACFDCTTGELLYYPLSDRSYGKHVGGYSASISKDWYFNNKVVYRLSDGLGLGVVSADVMGKDAVVNIDDTGKVVEYTLAEIQRQNPKDKTTKTQIVARPVWTMNADPTLDRIHVKAGNRLYGSNSEGEIAAIEVPQGNEQAKIVWRDRVRGRVWTMLAGDGKLFVVTEEGELYCFGARPRYSRNYPCIARELPPTSKKNCRHITQILGQNPDIGGYCLWLGIGKGRLLMEALRQLEMHVVAIEPDARKVASLRKRLDRAGLYGSRVAILHGEVDFADLPPYIASLVVVEDVTAAGLDRVADPIGKMNNVLRPYSGVAWIAAGQGEQLAICRQIANADLPGARVSATDDGLAIRRTGPVRGSADWTHQYGDVANSVCSKDRLKPPLGILWFGEESDFGDVLPRHAHGPPEQVVGGRLFIEGVDSFSARDVYTGRILWKKPLKPKANFGVYYDASYKHDFRDLSYNQGHIPGANVRGTDFVAAHDRIYLIQEDECLVLDPETGQTLKVFSLPGQGEGQRAHWAYIGVYEDYLLAGAGFVRYSPLLKPTDKKSGLSARFADKSASRSLVVMNRYDGRILWTMDAQDGFIHNGIVAGDEKVFFLDAAPPYVRRYGQKKGGGPKARLFAVDIHTGRVIWEDHDCAFGSWLSFSDQFGVLLQAHRKSRDMLWEPGNQMAAFRAETGEVLWDREMEYTGPCMIRGGTIFTQESAYDLLTGRQQTYPHPLTGQRIPWEYARNYGCGTAIASESILTFRSAAAGYYDLTNNSGTGNFGGFRSGCSSNLVVANGVLNAPDYTRTCTCSYQNQTSLAMIHMPDVEMWTFSRVEPSDAPIDRVGINLGAPGDRKAPNGTLWLEYPSVGGSSPELDVALTPEDPTWFRRHSLRLHDGQIKWVEASGAKGLRSIRIRLLALQEQEAHLEDDDQSTTAPSTSTVRLHFMEPEDNKKPGERRFDIALNGRTVLKDFDIVAEAKSPNVGIVKTFTGIQASDFLNVALTPADANSETVLCGIEITHVRTRSICTPDVPAAHGDRMSRLSLRTD